MAVFSLLSLRVVRWSDVVTVIHFVDRHQMCPDSRNMPIRYTALPSKPSLNIIFHNCQETVFTANFKYRLT